MRRQRLKVIAAVLVAAGVGLPIAGGNESTARTLLLFGLVYAVVVAVAEWRGRRP